MILRVRVCAGVCVHVCVHVPGGLPCCFPQKEGAEAKAREAELQKQIDQLHRNAEKDGAVDRVEKAKMEEKKKALGMFGAYARSLF